MNSRERPSGWVRAGRIHAVVLLSVGCAAADQPLSGSHVLQGEGVRGVLDAGRAGCSGAGLTLGLWGPAWGTDGRVVAQATREDDGAVWVYFPLQTGVGEGQAALRIEGRQALLPMGARPGEFEVAMHMEDGAAPDDEEALAARTAQALQAERRAWAEGAFLLRDGEQTVGAIQLRGEQPPLVDVFDETWFTDGPVLADRRDDGADLLLSFAVQPSLHGEDARVRINVPTRQVVVPLGDVPDPQDRHLRLEPGHMDEPARVRARAAARRAADAEERRWLEQDVGPGLAHAARTADGRCTSLGELDPAWGLMLAGYEVHVVAQADTCVVEIEPRVPQHRRRYRGRIGPDGPLPLDR